MKRLVILVILFLFHQQLFSQQDYSGVYGEKIPLSKEDRNKYTGLTPGEDDFGYDTKLILKKVSDNKYKFWLYVCKGFPSYNSGQIDGFVFFEGVSAKFFFTDSVWGGCKLMFVYKGNSVRVDHDYEFGGCGFGANVTAHGSYPLKRKLVKTIDIKYVFQYEVEEVIIKSSKAFIYRTATDQQPMKQYFIAGDKILNLTDVSDRIYTEYISKNGKFISGWINKSDLQ